MPLSLLSLPILHQILSTASSMAGFLDLPYELRSYIWTLSAIPRIVKLQFPLVAFGERSKEGVEAWKNHNGLLHVTSPTPVPVAFHVCHESRAILSNPKGLYEKGVSWGYNPRYIWIDFSRDVVDLGTTSVLQVSDAKIRIKRLQLTRKMNEHFSFYEHSHIWEFENFAEVFLTILDSTRMWSRKDHNWPCGNHNVWITESKNKRNIKLG